ncbi:hypothetical protein SLK74_21600, partial [Enterobacter asburiae]
NRLIRCVCGKKIGPDPRNFNQRVSLGRNDLLIRTFPKGQVAMCAFFLLGDELKANRQLQSCIERDYMNYFYFLEWPALPENVLSRFNIASQKVA